MRHVVCRLVVTNHELKTGVYSIQSTLTSIETGDYSYKDGILYNGGNR
jgi:hypothetical protein